MEYNELDYYICYECGQGDDEDVLLICDMCDFYCCHVYCDPELNDVFPSEDWFCKNCHQVMKKSEEENNRSGPIMRTQSLRNQSR
jgi:hypothetical protein